MSIESPGAGEPKRWGVRQTVATLGVAAAVAGVGGAAIYAATDGVAARTFSHGMPAGSPPGTMHQGSAHPEGATLHGEFVITEAAGGYATMLTQTGAVTEVSPTAVTVRSDDGFTQTYQLAPTNGGRLSVTANEEVVLRAVRTGQTATITDIKARVSPGGPGGTPGPARN